ncbi:HNH endonuclease [Bosea vaviloviae]|uniref:HNH endonuclease n=1 Tax=Bosea vaviloviae TaxID=1526658 RepID=UPI0009EC6341|nr:HNH endonuclease [Bosea vaviloviae]
MSEEIWKPISSWPGYFASSHGRVMRAIPRGSFKRPKILSGSRFNTGYLFLQSTFDGRKLSVGVHRLVCEAFHGPCPHEGWQCRHLDGSRDNNRPENLAWGSLVDNAADRREHGRDHLGSDHHNAKLDEALIVRLFELRAAGVSGKTIAAQLGMNRNTINKVLARTSWAHVDVSPDLIAQAHAVNARRRPPFARRPAGVALMGGVA